MKYKCLGRGFGRKIKVFGNGPLRKKKLAFRKVVLGLYTANYLFKRHFSSRQPTGHIFSRNFSNIMHSWGYHCLDSLRLDDFNWNIKLLKNLGNQAQFGPSTVIINIGSISGYDLLGRSKSTYSRSGMITAICTLTFEFPILPRYKFAFRVSSLWMLEMLKRWLPKWLGLCMWSSEFMYECKSQIDWVIEWLSIFTSV